jgi:hypothetical protein
MNDPTLSPPVVLYHGITAAGLASRLVDTPLWDKGKKSVHGSAITVVGFCLGRTKRVER